MKFKLQILLPTFLYTHVTILTRPTDPVSKLYCKTLKAKLFFTKSGMTKSGPSMAWRIEGKELNLAKVMKREDSFNAYFIKARLPNFQFSLLDFQVYL